VRVRLFVAVWPDPAAVEDLDDALAAIRRDHARQGPRWVASSRLHVTLVFLGELAESYVVPLEQELTDAMAGARPFATRIVGGGRFSNRILWAGLAGTDDNWPELARTTRRAVRATGASVAARPWQAHITVAYGRPSMSLDKYVGPLLEYTGPAFDVAEVWLIRSTLGPNPNYEVLSRFALGASIDPLRTD